MPVMDVAHQHMLSARAHGGDLMDWTALVGGERISAGLAPFAGRVSGASLLVSPHSVHDIEYNGLHACADDTQRRLERYEE